MTPAPPDAAAGAAPDRPPRQHVVVAGAEPIVLGSMLVTLVEPHRGHEVAYNRWYERDHFYAGCTIGPYQFAARRFVAPARLKRLRSPDPSAITGAPERGSYLALYWVLDGHHDLWNRWAVDQVNALHRAGRMFAERDHVHTLLYRSAWQVSRPTAGDDPGVTAELALDFPAPGLVAVWVDVAADEDVTAVHRWLETDVVPGQLGPTGAVVVVAATPLPLLIDAPGDVPRSEGDDRRLLTLWFLDRDPAEVWDGVRSAVAAIGSGGRATVVAALPFVPTVPGTDRYTDELWLDGP
jgi:hypothetical protein